MRRAALLSLVVIHCVLVGHPCRARRKPTQERRRGTTKKSLLSRIPGGRRRSGFLAGSSLGSVDLAGTRTSHQAVKSKDGEYAAAGGKDAGTRSRDEDEDGDRTFKAAAKRALMTILKERMGAVGDEAIEPTSRRVYVDRQAKNLHVRFQQSIHGLPIEGAALLLHVATPDLTVLALNGEFVPSTSTELRMLVSCHEAMEVARVEAAGGGGIGAGEQWEWTSPCVPAAVLGDDGLGHKCWKRTAEIRAPGQPVRREVLFASGVNGRLVARHPQTFGARALETRNCQSQTANCAVASASPNPISTGDKAIDAAHNNAIKVYNFLKNMYGRDSLDNAGMTIVSQAHYDNAYNNAFWDTEKNLMSYGDGDGTEYSFFSLGLDVVAHELGHGVTWYESRLTYQSEPGAINEALSDIFAASVERLTGGKAIDDTWLIGEDVALAGDPFRDMSDPALYFDGRDYYPDRYKGEDDAGGIHVNSGIANLAFVLMVSGGKHPRKKTDITVPRYRASFNDSMKDAAALFYSANAGCLTPSSGFNVLRECLLLFTNSTSDEAKINAAFSAVGIMKPAVASLTNGVPLANQKGSFFDTYYFKLDGVQAGEAVNCQTSADNGDADLFVRVGELPDPYEFSTLNDCMSGNTGSDEECTTDPLIKSDAVYVAVRAAEDYAQLSVLCSRTGSISKLTSGVALAGQQGIASSTVYYVLEDLRRGSAVTCATTGSVGDADLFVRIGSMPEPYVDGANDCQSVTAGVSNQTCTAVNRLLETSPAYVAVYAATAFDGLTLNCTVRQGSGGGGNVGGGGGGGGGNVGTGTGNTTFASLTNGRPLRNQNASPSRTKHYTLKKGATTGEEVTCSLSGGTGDGNLFVRFGSKANPNKPQVNACYSQTLGLNDQCTTSPVKKSADTFVAVSTVSGFTNVTVTCTRKWKCSVRQQSCRTNKDCCSSDLKCTGPTPSTRVCKKRASTANCGRRRGGLIVTRSCPGTSNNNSASGEGGGGCVSRGGPCLRRSDCCGRGQGRNKVLTCDGVTKESRTCKACLSRGSTCQRNNQCCKGHRCLRGSCRPIQ